MNMSSEASELRPGSDIFFNIQNALLNLIQIFIGPHSLEVTQADGFDEESSSWLMMDSFKSLLSDII